jgi:site-specific recombinase XerC
MCPTAAAHGGAGRRRIRGCFTELVTLTVGHVSLATGAHIKMTGKGRKRRTITLTPEAVAVLRGWLKERQGQPEDPAFPTRRGTPLSRDAVEPLVAKHARSGATHCQSLTSKRVTPHTLRHYVDGWVMWPAGVFPLVGGSCGPVPAT